MNPDILSDGAKLSDQELVTQVHILARREREAITALIAHLAVFDERRLYLGEGCSSLFVYCTQVLHFSEHAAYNRIEAARAARKYPVILALLAEGSLNLATVRLLAPELTPANHRELLEAAKHRSKREVEELVVRLHPQPRVPASIRRLPMPRPSLVTPASSAGSGADGAALEPRADELIPISLIEPSTATSDTPRPVPITVRPAIIAPLAPKRYKMQFTASAEIYEKFRLAQALLRHQIPDGDLAVIFDRALTVLLEVLTKQTFAATERPRDRARERARASVSRSRHIPAEVRRAVWRRDGGQCAFISPTGRRCTERGFLEFHHVVPFSVGGASSTDNIQLRCRAHNGYEAEQAFGARRTESVQEPGAAHVRLAELFPVMQLGVPITTAGPSEHARRASAADNAGGRQDRHR